MGQSPLAVDGWPCAVCALDGNAPKNGNNASAATDDRRFTICMRLGIRLPLYCQWHDKLVGVPTPLSASAFHLAEALAIKKQANTDAPTCFLRCNTEPF